MVQCALLLYFSLSTSHVFAKDFFRTEARAQELERPAESDRLRRPLRVVDASGDEFPHYFASSEFEPRKLQALARMLRIESQVPLWDTGSQLYLQIGVSALRSISITRWELSTAGELQIHHTSEYTSHIVEETAAGRIEVTQTVPSIELISRIISVPYWPTETDIGFGLDPEIFYDFRKIRDAFNRALGSRAPKLTREIQRRFKDQLCDKPLKRRR